MTQSGLIWKVGVGQMNTILPFEAYFGFTYAYSNMLAGRKIKRAREPRQPKKSQSITETKRECGDYPVRVILSPVVMLPAVALPAVVALPRCCTAETGVTVARPTTPTTPNAATIAIARTNIFEFIDH
jgi:hypothetical protein